MAKSQTWPMAVEIISFRCYLTGRTLELSMEEKRRPGQETLRARIGWKGEGEDPGGKNSEYSGYIEETAELGPARLKDLARWLDALDAKRLPDFELGALGLRLRYGHFEKGEVYYTVSIQTKEDGLIHFSEYDQAGNSNRFKARRIMDALRHPGV